MRQDTISNLLRAKQYIIPNYPLPPNEDKIEILRVVVRESMSFDLLDRLVTDICQTTQDLIVSEYSLVGGDDVDGEKRLKLEFILTAVNRTTIKQISQSSQVTKTQAPRNNTAVLVRIQMLAQRKEGEARGL